MARLTLETILPDIITEILHSFDSYKDLQAFITSSPTFYNLFKGYENSILAQTAQNIISYDAWEDATTVLIYQRNTIGATPDYPATKADLENKFILQKKDIPHIIANQRFFHSVEADLDAYVYLYYVEDEEPATEATAVALPPLPSFTPEEPLPIKFFYKTWKLSLQFGNESIATFAQHSPLSEQQLVDLSVYSHLIIENSDFGDFISLPRWNLLAPGTPRMDLFTVLARQGPRVIKNGNTCPLLIFKMIRHLSVAITLGQNDGGVWSATFGLLMDCDENRIEAVVDKYGLDMNWE